MNSTLKVATMVACTLGIASHASAGEITAFAWSSGVASIAGIAVAPPTALNNDNQVGDSPNLIQVFQKHYVGIGPVDIEFTVTDSIPPGTTEYRFEEGVQNSTGVDWTGYSLQLGYGVGGSFMLSSPGDGLDFDFPDYDSPVSFTVAPGYPFTSYSVVSEDHITATGGLQPDGGYAEPFVFHIDVPDGIDSFTLRQFPIPTGVPEPGSLGLAVLLACVCATSRKRVC